MSVLRTLVSYNTYQLLIYTLKSNYMKNDKRDFAYLVSSDIALITSFPFYILNLCLD